MQWEESQYLCILFHFLPEAYTCGQKVITFINGMCGRQCPPLIILIKVVHPNNIDKGCTS